MVDEVARARLRPPPAELELLDETLTEEELLLLARLELEAEALRRRRSERALARVPMLVLEQRSAPSTLSSEWPEPAAAKAAALRSVVVISMIAAPQKQSARHRQAVPRQVLLD